MRREIQIPALVAGLALLLCAQFAMADAPESAEMATRRKEMKQRERRIIYNNDGDDIFLRKISSPQEFLRERTEPALGTQVDSIFYCTVVTTAYSHDTDVAERLDELVDAIDATDKHPVNCRRNMRMLREAGKDCLELVVDRCHEAGVEIFWTHRINDIHDTFTPWLLSQWKRKNPQFVMGKPEDREKYPNTDPRHWWSTLDFEKPEVMDYLYRITEEVCRRYDVDGIEIDYFRHPMFFRPNLEFKPATAEQVKIMTAFQRRLRELAYREGNRRGRPILVAARVPITTTIGRHVGIDIQGWLEEGLLDVLTTEAGYVPFTMPTRELVDLGHAYDVPVYPTISASGMQGRHSSVEAWCGVASNIWRAGADGIVLFNTFPSKPGHPHFTKLGDPKALSHFDKLFAIDNRPILLGCLVQGIVQSQSLPQELDSSGTVRQVNLPVGDDIAGAANVGRLKNVMLHVQFTEKTPQDKVELRLNDEVIAPAGEKGGWVTYLPKPDQLRPGDNVLQFSVARRAAGQKPIVVQSVELSASYQ